MRIYDDLIVAVFRLNGALVSAGDALVDDLGLSTARWQVLGALIFADQPLTVSGIAREMGLTRQGVQRNVNKLRDQGFVSLDDNPQDSRAHLVFVTDAGAVAYEQAMERRDAWLKSVNPDLSTAEVRSLVEDLWLVREGIEAEADRINNSPETEVYNAT